MLDKLDRNWRVVKQEIAAWWAAMKWGVSRFRSEPDQPRTHLAMAMLKDTFALLPRTLSYITVISIAIWLLALLAGCDPLANSR